MRIHRHPRPVWLRCACASADADAGRARDLELRGFLFVEPRATAHIASPAAPLLQGAGEGFRPNVTARLPGGGGGANGGGSTGGGATLAFEFTPPFVPANVPASVRLRAPGDFSTADDLEISVDGWPQFSLLSIADCAPLAGGAAEAATAAAAAGPQSSPDIVIVSKMLFGQDPSFVAAVVAASLAHHTSLTDNGGADGSGGGGGNGGGARWEMFATRAQAAAMLRASPELCAAARGRRLAFVGVGGLAHYRRLRYAHQCLAAARAALAHWGANERLLFTDYDEWAALPPGATLQSLLARHGDPAVLYLERRRAVSPGLGAPAGESAAWRSAAAFAGICNSSNGSGNGGGSAAAALLALLEGYTLREAAPAPPGSRAAAGALKVLVDLSRVDQVCVFEWLGWLGQTWGERGHHTPNACVCLLSTHSASSCFSSPNPSSLLPGLHPLRAADGRRGGRTAAV